VAGVKWGLAQGMDRINSTRIEPPLSASTSRLRIRLAAEGRAPSAVPNSTLAPVVNRLAWFSGDQKY
jgi:hypothetical protein